MATLLSLISGLFMCWTSAHGHAFITVTHNRSQHFEYEHMFVSCEQFGSGEWKVWRYTIQGLTLAQCGIGWGSQTSSACNISTVKVGDSGVYWCESKYRDSSNAISITVTNKPVILQSPVLPVTEGHDVTLRCIAKNSSNLTADFYKDGSLMGTEPTGHMTIHRFSKPDEGAYTCNITGHGQSPPSWLLMKDDSDPVSLTPFPDWSQRFEYENLSLNCGGISNVRGWTVKRSTTSGRKVSSCGESWGIPAASGCVLRTTKQSDSAYYWCESPARQRSNSVNITIYDKPVILQSPVVPVTEGHVVTLHCRAKNSSNLPADFFKDDLFMGTEPTGHMTIHRVTKSDEGLYKCHISGRGESPPSWLLVRAAQSTSPAIESSVRTLTTVRHIIVCSPYFICTLLILSIYRQKPAGRTPPVSMRMVPPGDTDRELEPQYEDVIANVTTEHHF